MEKNNKGRSLYVHKYELSNPADFQRNRTLMGRKKGATSMER